MALGAEAGSMLEPGCKSMGALRAPSSGPGFPRTYRTVASGVGPGRMTMDQHEHLSVGAVPALISFFDATHVCRFANEHHCRWYGRSPEELVGLHMRDFLGTEGYERRLPHLRRVEAGEEVSFEASVPHLDGSWRDAAIRYVPRFGPGGFEGFHTLVFDVAAQQHRFHSVFDGTVVAFWEIDLTALRGVLDDLRAQGVGDLAGYAAGRTDLVREALSMTPVRDLNAKAMELFGTSRAEAIGRPLGDWCPPESLPVWNANMIAYLSGQASFEADTVMMRSDGGRIDVLLNCAFPKKPEDQNIVIVGFVDIASRVAQEHQLAKAQADLAHASRVATLGELMASIAHEVNQPLAAVVTSGNAALRWLRREVPDLGEVEAAISQMIGEGTRASEIIMRTRMMAAKGNGERTAIGPNLLVEDALAISRRQISGLGADLDVQLGGGLPRILGDRVQLQQVLINLLINAAQAMADQVEERRITIRTSLVADGVLFDVRDTGPGFPTDGAAQVFNAFYTTKPTGMGMGLSVSKTIVEAHGGWIRAANGQGGGAVFEFTLPFAEDACGTPDVPVEQFARAAG